MGLLVKVVRGNADAAARTFFRVLAGGPGGAVGAAKSRVFGRNAGRVGGSEARRIERGLGRRRREGKELHDALGVVFRRRARGF